MTWVGPRRVAGGTISGIRTPKPGRSANSFPGGTEDGPPAASSLVRKHGNQRSSPVTARICLTCGVETTSWSSLPSARASRRARTSTVRAAESQKSVGLRSTVIAACPVAIARSSAARNSAALPMSISHGATTTGAPAVISMAYLASGTLSANWQPLRQPPRVVSCPLEATANPADHPRVIFLAVHEVEADVPALGGKPSSAPGQCPHTPDSAQRCRRNSARMSCRKSSLDTSLVIRAAATHTSAPSQEKARSQSVL